MKFINYFSYLLDKFDFWDKDAHTEYQLVNLKFNLRHEKILSKFRLLLIFNILFN